MESIHSYKIRHQDTNDYLNADTQEITYNYQPITQLIKNLWNSFSKFLSNDPKSDLPKFMQASFFFNKPQKYRPVPTKKIPQEALEELKEVGKGFDPIMMTLSRCLKEQKQQQEEILQMTAIKKRKVSFEQEVPPLKKIIKRYYFQDDQKERDQLQTSLETRQKKIECALDQLVKDYEEKKIKLQEKSFKGFFKIQKQQEVKQPQKQINNQTEQSKLLLQEKKAQVISTANLMKIASDNLNQAKPKIIQQNVNPFKTKTPTKPFSLIQLIQSSENKKNLNSSPSQSQTTQSDIASPFTFSPYSHNQSDEKPSISTFSNLASHSFNSSLQGKSTNQTTYGNAFNNNQNIIIHSNQKTSLQFNQFNQTSKLLAPEHSKIIQPQQNHFLKGVNGMNSNGTIKDFFKPNNSSSSNQLFDSTSSEKTQRTQKKTPQPYRNKRREINVRIQ